HLALKTLQLRADDPDPEHDRDEDDEVRGGDVLPFRGRVHAERISRSSRICASRRLPASSTWYSVANSTSIAASETQNVKNCEPVICGPCEVNTTGWMNFCDSLIARNETGIRTTPKSA